MVAAAVARNDQARNMNFAHEIEKYPCIYNYRI